MSLVTVEGTYVDGRVELDERPKGIEASRVIVTFMYSTEPDPLMGRELARQRAFRRMAAGLEMGGCLNREEVYSDRIEELDARRGR
jgi:hypothetical protein